LLRKKRPQAKPPQTAIACSIVNTRPAPIQAPREAKPDPEAEVRITAFFARMGLTRKPADQV
jgi:hypothetical protein